MQAVGMEIGSHTVSPARLAKVDDERLRAELVDSKSALENARGTEVGSFAFPYGDWDKRCEMFVKNTGYTAACTTRTGWTFYDKTPYRLRRRTVFNTDMTGRLAHKLAFGSHDLSWSALVLEAPTGRAFPR